MVKPIIPKFDEYYIYAPNGFFTKDSGSKSQIKISKDSIAYSGSGLMDAGRKMVLGYLHKAIKPMNNLRMGEDAQIIYRVSRAP